MTHLEGHNEGAVGPFFNERLEDLRHLVHLDVQAAFARLYLVLRLGETVVQFIIRPCASI
jgi:hypothetical protein